MKIMPNILSILGGKCKQAHDLCGFGVSGSAVSLEEPMCMCFGGTDVKVCFCSALKGMSKSGILYGSSGPAAFKKTLGLSRFTGLSAIFLECTHY